MDDAELLRRYAEERSEAAFAELVRRHLDLVFSAALRQVAGDSHLAQDVAQSVFTDLARKASSLSRRAVLTGWLYTSTRYAAARIVRGERRRQAREREAQTMHEQLRDSGSELDWDRLCPVLDDVMHELTEHDSEAILLRYFKGQQFTEIGAKLGLSENAARMRVYRALDKMRVLLAKRGIASTSAALAMTLAHQAVAAAPAGLAATVTGASLASAAVATGTGFTILKIMTMTKLKAGIISALVVAGLATPLVIQHRTLARLQEENAALRENSRQLAQLRDENERFTKSQLTPDELERLRREHNELLRLRGRINLLRRESQELASRTKQAGTGADGNAASNAVPLPVVANFQASVRANIGNGSTLVTGGWSTKSGRHVLALVTPRIETAGAGQTVNVKTQLIEAPDEVLATLGLAAFKTDNIESSLKEVLSPEKAEAMLKALKEAEEVDFIASPGVTTHNGQQAQVQVTESRIIGGESHMLGPIIDIIPQISPDGTSIDIDVVAQVKTVVPSPP